MKRSPFWKTYAALLVLGGLGAYIYFVENKREVTPEGEVKKKKEKVFAFDKAKARVVTVAQPAGETARVVREKDGWRMSAPWAVAADGAEVDGLLGALEGLETEEVVAETPAKPSEYGLEPPRGTVTLEVEGAPAPLVLQLGEKTPDGGAVYARTATAARVFTVPAFAEGSLLKKPFDLRDRNVLHLSRDAVRSLEITGPEGDYALAKGEGEEWSITKPLATRAGRWPVDGLLGTLESLRMDEVAAEEAKDLKPFGLHPPARTLTIVMSDGTRRVLELGALKPPAAQYAHVAGSPLVAVIPGALSEDLAKGLDALRAKRLLDVATYEVAGIELEARDTPKRVLARSSHKDKEGVDVYTWKRTAPDAKDVLTNTVQDALFQVGAVDVRAFVDAPQDPTAYGLDAPLLKVSLRHDGGKPPAWFEIGKKDGAVYGRRSGDAAVLELEPQKAEEVLKGFGGL